MIITLDVGNSNTVLGGYRDGKIVFVSRIATDQGREADQYAVELCNILHLYDVKSKEIEGIILASVVPALTPLLIRALKHVAPVQPLVFSLADAGDIEVAIDNPRELGMDLLASAVAVKKSYPLPAVIIDMGTATKFTALDKNGVLRGVSIAPGLYVSLKALIQNASALNGIPLEAPKTAIGRNTAESMKSGLVLGTASMLDGMIDRFAREMAMPATVVATGGAAPVVVPYCSHKVEYKDTLLLDGLYEAYVRRGGTGGRA